MINQALAYLESKGLIYADPAYYILHETNSYAGIVVDIVDRDGVAISVAPSLADYDRHVIPKITLNSSQGNLLEPILDTLIFAIEHGKIAS
jgi:hypothetical protein